MIDQSETTKTAKEFWKSSRKGNSNLTKNYEEVTQKRGATDGAVSTKLKKWEDWHHNFKKKETEDSNEKPLLKSPLPNPEKPLPDKPPEKTNGGDNEKTKDPLRRSDKTGKSDKTQKLDVSLPKTERGKAEKVFSPKTPEKKDERPSPSSPPDPLNSPTQTNPKTPTTSPEGKKERRSQKVTRRSNTFGHGSEFRRIPLQDLENVIESKRKRLASNTRTHSNKSPESKLVDSDKRKKTPASPEGTLKKSSALTEGSNSEPTSTTSSSPQNSSSIQEVSSPKRSLSISLDVLNEKELKEEPKKVSKAKSTSARINRVKESDSSPEGKPSKEDLKSMERRKRLDEFKLKLKRREETQKRLNTENLVVEEKGQNGKFDIKKATSNLLRRKKLKVEDKTDQKEHKKEIELKNEETDKKGNDKVSKVSDRRERTEESKKDKGDEKNGTDKVVMEKRDEKGSGRREKDEKATDRRDEGKEEKKTEKKTESKTESTSKKETKKELKDSKKDKTKAPVVDPLPIDEKEKKDSRRKKEKSSARSEKSTPHSQPLPTPEQPQPTPEPIQPPQPHPQPQPQPPQPTPDLTLKKGTPRQEANPPPQQNDTQLLIEKKEPPLPKPPEPKPIETKPPEPKPEEKIEPKTTEDKKIDLIANLKPTLQDKLFDESHESDSDSDIDYQISKILIGISHNKLTTVDIKTMGLEDEQIGDILESLISNTSVTTLLLDGNDLEMTSFYQLNELLLKNTTITHLSLNFAMLGELGAYTIQNGLAQNTSVTFLSLSGNDLFENGISALGVGLKDNSAILTLNLSDNSISDAGCKSLSEVISTNSVITKLDISNNYINEEGAKYLSEMLQFNSSLKSLNLERNSLEDGGCIALTMGLSLNSTLRELHLGNNIIETLGMRALAEMLIESECGLAGVDLRQNIFEIESEIALQEVMLKKKHITIIWKAPPQKGEPPATLSKTDLLAIAEFMGPETIMDVYKNNKVLEPLVDVELVLIHMKFGPTEAQSMWDLVFSEKELMNGYHHPLHLLIQILKNQVAEAIPCSEFCKLFISYIDFICSQLKIEPESSFNFTKLQLFQLSKYILKLDEPIVSSAIVKSNFLPLITELFWKYPSSSVFLTEFVDLMEHLINSDSPSAFSVLSQIFINNGFLLKMMNHLMEESKLSIPQHCGNFGHLTKIANFTQKALSKNKKLEKMVEGVPSWESFVGTLETINQVFQIPAPLKPPERSPVDPSKPIALNDSLV